MTEQEFIDKFNKQILSRIEQFEQSLEVEGVVDIQKTWDQIVGQLIPVGILPREAVNWKLFKH